MCQCHQGDRGDELASGSRCSPALAAVQGECGCRAGRRIGLFLGHESVQVHAKGLFLTSLKSKRADVLDLLAQERAQVPLLPVYINLLRFYYLSGVPQGVSPA